MKVPAALRTAAAEWRSGDVASACSKDEVERDAKDGQLGVARTIGPFVEHQVALVQPDLINLELECQFRHEIPAQSERQRSEEHTSELQSLMRNSYAVFCLKKKN